MSPKAWLVASGEPVALPADVACERLRAEQLGGLDAQRLLVPLGQQLRADVRPLAHTMLLQALIMTQICLVMTMTNEC